MSASCIACQRSCEAWRVRYHRGEVQLRLPFLQFVEQPSRLGPPAATGRATAVRSSSCASAARGATSFAFVPTARCASPFRVAARAARRSVFVRRHETWIARERSARPRRARARASGSDGSAILLRGEPVRVARRAGRATLPGAWPTANARPRRDPATMCGRRSSATCATSRARELVPRLHELAHEHGLRVGASRSATSVRAGARARATATSPSTSGSCRCRRRSATTSCSTS